MDTQTVILTGRYLFRKLFDIRVSQASPLPGGNIIIAANHHGWVDPLLITFFWPARVDFMYIGPRDANANTAWKKALYDRYPGVILTEQRWGWPGRQAYASVLQGLRRGKSLMIFPEGDAYPEEGQVRPFASGAIHFALRTASPIVPVGLCGTAELYYRKQLQMRIGPPIPVPQGPATSRALVNQMREDLQARISALVLDYRDPPAARKPMRWLTHLF